MVSRKVVASLLVVYVVAMLAEQTEGYLAFFTRSDIERMQWGKSKGTGSVYSQWCCGGAGIPSEGSNHQPVRQQPKTVLTG
uniref:Uncharacterized protein n=1 Tax=Gopherus evgoodei TaxID=1825980 RepID=A0A8C4XXR8_9SAUR